MADPARRPSPDDLYNAIAADYGRALERLAAAYEHDTEKRRDLVQDIHFALWRSLATFDGECSLRTWVYRVAHNTAISRVVRRRAAAPALVRIEELDDSGASPDLDHAIDEQRVRDRLMALIHSLKPLDREVMTLYLEDVDAAAIADITGLSTSNVATKVHRIKQVLRQRFHEVQR
jgi:RNA polymerase sigma-70 factor (ECF subfamily)